MEIFSDERSIAAVVVVVGMFGGEVFDEILGDARRVLPSAILQMGCGWNGRGCIFRIIVSGA